MKGGNERRLMRMEEVSGRKDLTGGMKCGGEKTCPWFPGLCKRRKGELVDGSKGGHSMRVKNQGDGIDDWGQIQGETHSRNLQCKS